MKGKDGSKRREGGREGGKTTYAKEIEWVEDGREGGRNCTARYAVTSTNPSIHPSIRDHME